MFNKVVYLAALKLKIDRETAGTIARSESASTAFLLENPQKEKQNVSPVKSDSVEKDFSGVRLATKNDTDKTRTKIQTRYRRAIMGKADSKAKADIPKNKRQKPATCGASGSKTRQRGTSQPLLDDDHNFKENR